MSKDILRLYSVIDGLYTLGSEKIQEISSVINKPLFTVMDSPFSYRQINYLGNTQILPKKKEKAGKWRKFSLKEIAFLLIVKELRSYGFKDSLLLALKNAFFGGKKGFEGDMAIIAVLGGLGVNLTIDREENAHFYDMPTFSFLRGKEQASLMVISLNVVVTKIWGELGKQKVEYKDESALLSEVLADYFLTEKEKEIIGIIRNKDYSEISVKKQGAEDFLVMADKKAEITERDLIEMIQTKQFANIEVIKRNGQIVNVRVAETFKI